MLKNKLVYIKTKNVSSIVECKGQIIDNGSNIFIDTYNLGRIISTKIKVVDLFDEVGLEGIIYYNTFDEGFSLFNIISKKYEKVEYLSEIIHLIEPVQEYRANILALDIEKDKKMETIYLAPVTLTNLIYRPTGENLEIYLKGLLNEAKDSGLYAVVVIDKNSSNPLPIPSPYKQWFFNGGTMGVYVDGVFVPEDKYIINMNDNTIQFKDFPTGLPIDSKIEFTFFNTIDNLKIYKNRFISTREQRVFELDFIYTLGLHSVEVYVNGIKQPDECYTESSPTSVTLNATIPENSEVVIQAGKLVPRDSVFYEDFESRTISAIEDNVRITTYPKDKSGKIRSLEEHFDSNNRVILRVAKFDGIEVKRETLKYNEDGSIIIRAE